MTSPLRKQISACYCNVLLMRSVLLTTWDPRLITYLWELLRGVLIETNLCVQIMAKFHAPVIQDNPSGWGPCAVPEKFKDMPYQPFSKGDRLGKVGYNLITHEALEVRLDNCVHIFPCAWQVADWTGATYQDKRYTSKTLIHYLLFVHICVIFSAPERRSYRWDADRRGKRTVKNMPRFWKNGIKCNKKQKMFVSLTVLCFCVQINTPLSSAAAVNTPISTKKTRQASSWWTLRRHRRRPTRGTACALLR